MARAIKIEYVEGEQESALLSITASQMAEDLNDSAVDLNDGLAITSELLHRKYTGGQIGLLFAEAVSIAAAKRTVNI